MDMRIIKRKVSYCEICEDVKALKDSWDEGQNLLVENGEQEEPVPFPGVSGYTIKDADEYKYSHTEICENCMNALMKGVNIINVQKLTGISMNTDTDK